MKSLQALSLEKIADMKLQNSINQEVYNDSVFKYSQHVADVVAKSRKRHLFYLIQYYYVSRLLGNRIVYYAIEDWENIPRWKLIQWCACEVTFGSHSIEGALWRIRLEMPFENEIGASLEYPVEAFENALSRHCPNNKGTVHDWIKVFRHVPTKILMYEDFFG